MTDAAPVLQQLDAARLLALKDAALYAQIIPGVLSVIASSQIFEHRRWGADFLAETFASRVVSDEDKQKLSLLVLDTLKSYLSRKEDVGEDEDPGVVKAAVQCAASIYPLVFRYAIGKAEDATAVWAKMSSMKSSILKRMDGAPSGVRICCIKFVASVVLVQTPGVIVDPRRPEQNETSLALVPRDHAILTPKNLEPEASGLLDRLLGVLQDNTEDPLIATATLNSLSSLVHRRASISGKILTTVVNFNPLRLASPGKIVTGKDKVAVQSMTRTTILFLSSFLKRNSNHASAPRVQQQLDRLRHGLIEVFSDPQRSLKRDAPDEPIDGLDREKRIKLDGQAEAGMTPQQQMQMPWPPPLPPGPVSLAQLFNLSNDPRVAGFNVGTIAPPFVLQLVPALLTQTRQGQLDAAVEAVQRRLLELERRPPPGLALEVEEDDDYDPMMGFAGDAEDREMPFVQPQQVAIRLAPPPPLTEREKSEYGDATMERLFETLRRLEDRRTRTDQKKAGGADEKGFNRLASAVMDREGWITLLSRLATRPGLHLSEEEDVKQENEDRTLTKKGGPVGEDLPSKIRDGFHTYIMDDWRRRIETAIAWLNEEWYADRILAKQNPDSASAAELPNYTRLAVRLLDSLVPYLDKTDRMYFIRFLSEIPSIPPQMFSRVVKLAEDPERVQITVQTLLYLIMFKPPARAAAIECAMEMWRTNKDARASVEKLILSKWKPEVLQDAKEMEDMKQEG